MVNSKSKEGEGSLSILAAAKSKQYDIVKKYIDKKSITWTKSDVNELIHAILVSKVDLTYPKYPEKIFTNLFTQHAHMIDLEKRYNGDREDTLFIEAARLGSIALLKLIKKYFPQVKTDQRNKLEQTGLMYACFNGELATVKYLIETLKADISLKDRGNYTSFMRASQRGQLAVVQYLLEVQAIQLDEQIGELKNSIRLAIKGNHHQVVGYLLQNFKEQLNKTEINDIAQYIAECGAYEVMKIFLEFQEAFEFKSVGSGNQVVASPFLTALIQKSRKRQNLIDYREEGKKLAILELLVDENMIDLKTEKEMLNPGEAMRNNQFPIAKYLIEEGHFEIDEELATELFRSTAIFARNDALDYLLMHDKAKTFFDLKRKDDANLTFLQYLMGESMPWNDSTPDKQKIAMLQFLDQEEYIDLEGEEGKEIAYLAAKNNRAQVVESIFFVTESPPGSEDLHKLFYIAIDNGSYDVVSMLLKDESIRNNFDINTKVTVGKVQRSCLDIFIKPVSSSARDLSRQAKILELLFQYSKIDCNNEEQTKAIWFTACLQGNLSTLAYLFKDKVVQPTIRNNQGQNGLIVAIVKPDLVSLDVIKFLAETVNININEKDASKKTAYEYALESNQKNLIDYIKSIKKGPESKDEEEQKKQEQIKEGEEKKKKLDQLKKDEEKKKKQEQIKEDEEKKKKLDQLKKNEEEQKKKLEQLKEDDIKEKGKQYGTNSQDQRNEGIKIKDKEDSPEKDFEEKNYLQDTNSDSLFTQEVSMNDNEESVEQEMGENALKNGDNDLNEGKPTDFKFIVKVVVALIGGMAILFGIPYYFFTKKQGQKEVPK